MKTKSFPYKTSFVVNPHSGGGRGGKTWNTIESYLREKGVNYEVYFSGDDEGDVTKTAARASRDGAELIVVVGGDGTLKEAVNGIDLEKNILGLIAGGTANGFRRSVRVPHNAILALKGLFYWPVIEMDLGKVNDNIFLNAVGVGFDAQVSQTATDDNYWLKGYPGYVSACFQHINFPPRAVSYRLDNREVQTKETFLTVVANGRFYGGQLCIAPQAKIDDGLLDFEIVDPISNPRKVVMGVLTFARKFTWMNGIHLDKAKELVINCEDDTMPVQIDGETKNMEKFPLKFQVMEKALKIVSPYNIKFPYKYLGMSK